MKSSAFSKEDFGKLFIRVVLGAILAAKGVVFFVQGKTALVSLGKILNTIGITFWPLYFGWVLAIVCVVCGITFVLGAFFRTTTFLLGTFSLLDAIFKYYSGYKLMDGVLYAVILSAVMYGFMLIGAGSYSVQK